MLQYRRSDGGRREAGFKGTGGDCVVRALALMTGKPYRACYNELAVEAYADVAKNGQKWTHDYIERKGVLPRTYAKVYKANGLVKARLPKGALPTYTEAVALYGRCIAKTRRHVVHLNGQGMHDTFDGRLAHFWATGEVVERKAVVVWVHANTQGSN